MIFLELIIEFFKIGLFSVGGGLATLPFLYELAANKPWISVSDISNLVAISESTPGPLGVNMATYVGFLQSNIIGSILAPLSLVLPSLIITFIISGFLKKFKDSKVVKNVFYGLRAASCALIATAGIGVLKLAFFGEKAIKFANFFWEGLILGVILLIATKKLKWHPVAFIAISAVVGIIFKFEI